MAIADHEADLNLDVESQSIRGRVCPNCGGKIIPSNTAIFQGQADPSAIYVSWQCERCGHEEVFEPATTETKHGKPSSGRPANGSVARGDLALDGKKSDITTNGDLSPELKGLPPDVRKLLSIMKNPPRNPS